jgi:hypothetical protein
MLYDLKAGIGNSFIVNFIYPSTADGCFIHVDLMSRNSPQMNRDQANHFMKSCPRCGTDMLSSAQTKTVL